MAASIRYIRFRGAFGDFYDWRENTKIISRHKGILKHLGEKVEISTEDKAENDEEKMKIYEGNSKTYDFPIMILTDIYFRLVSQCDESAHDAWKS